MKKIILLAMLTLLVACNGVVEPGAPCPDPAPAADAGAIPDAAPDVQVADAARSCVTPHPHYPNVLYTVEVDSVAPATVALDTHGPPSNVTLKGCGFTGVLDVQVNVMTVPFTVVDDATIVLSLPFWHRDDFETLPTTVQIDVIKVQPDQAQIDLTFN